MLAKWAWAKLNKTVFLSLEFHSNICALVLAMMGLAFLSGTLNGSLPDILNKHQFRMEIVWLVKWA